MPDLTLEIRRLPKPGKNYELIEAITNRLKGSGRRGLVSAALTTPHGGDRDVVAALRISGWEELEELSDAAMSSTAVQKEQIDIEELCVKTPTIQVLDVIERGDQPSLGKYMRRTFFHAKRGESPSLVDALLAWRSAMPDGKRPTVQRQVSGSLDLVRVTAGYGSIKDMMESTADLSSNPSYSKYRDQVNSLTASANRRDYKIVYINAG